MGKAKKRYISSKELIKGNMFWVGFLAQVVKSPSNFIIFVAPSRWSLIDFGVFFGE